MSTLPNRDEKIYISIENLTNIKLLNSISYEMITRNKDFQKALKLFNKYNRIDFDKSEEQLKKLYTFGFSKYTMLEHNTFQEANNKMEDELEVSNILNNFDRPLMVENNTENLYQINLSHPITDIINNIKIEKNKLASQKDRYIKSILNKDTETLANMFFVYDCFQANTKKKNIAIESHIRHSIYEYFNGKKDITERTIRSYYTKMQNYIDNQKYKYLQ